MQKTQESNAEYQVPTFNPQSTDNNPLIFISGQQNNPGKVPEILPVEPGKINTVVSGNVSNILPANLGAVGPGNVTTVPTVLPTGTVQQGNCSAILTVGNGQSYGNTLPTQQHNIGTGSLTMATNRYVPILPKSTGNQLRILNVQSCASFLTNNDYVVQNQQTIQNGPLMDFNKNVPTLPNGDSIVKKEVDPIIESLDPVTKYVAEDKKVENVQEVQDVQENSKNKDHEINSSELPTKSEPKELESVVPEVNSALSLPVDSTKEKFNSEHQGNNKNELNIDDKVGHQDIAEKRLSLQCPKCHTRCNGKKALYMHITYSVCIAKRSECAQCFVCNDPNCTVLSQGTIELWRHIKRHNPSLKDNSDDIRFKYCPKCGQSCKRPGHMHRHLTTSACYIDKTNKVCKICMDVGCEIRAKDKDDFWRHLTEYCPSITQSDQPPGDMENSITGGISKRKRKAGKCTGIRNNPGSAKKSRSTETPDVTEEPKEGLVKALPDQITRNIKENSTDTKKSVPVLKKEVNSNTGSIVTTFNCPRCSETLASGRQVYSHFRTSECFTHRSGIKTCLVCNTESCDVNPFEMKALWVHFKEQYPELKKKKRNGWKYGYAKKNRNREAAGVAEQPKEGIDGAPTKNETRLVSFPCYAFHGRLLNEFTGVIQSQKKSIHAPLNTPGRPDETAAAPPGARPRGPGV